jgi:hypothetical protein
VIDGHCGDGETCAYELRVLTAAGSSGPSATATVGG